MIKQNQSGFTLIELLVVVAIIGILAAIAIPQFAAYRAKGFDARAESDCRNAATAEEAYFVDNATYSSAAADLPGFVQSEDVNVALVGTDTNFTVTCDSPKGTAGFSCTWTSDPAAGQPNMVCTTICAFYAYTRHRGGRSLGVARAALFAAEDIDVPNTLVLHIIWIAAAVTILVPSAADPDLWGHLLFGSALLDGTWHVENTFAYTTPAQPWVNHELLAELFMAGIYRLGVPTRARQRSRSCWRSSS
jgi:type IV pilus assembly protein PilA